MFIDEIDAVGSAKNPKDQQNTRMTLNQLLPDSTGSRRTRASSSPPPPTRPRVTGQGPRPSGQIRRDRRGAPDVDGRKQILETRGRGHDVAGCGLGRVIARGTPGFSGADLNLVNVAALRAALDGAAQVGMKQLDARIAY